MQFFTRRRLAPSAEMSQICVRFVRRCARGPKRCRTPLSDSRAESPSVGSIHYANPVIGRAPPRSVEGRRADEGDDIRHSFVHSLNPVVRSARRALLIVA